MVKVSKNNVRLKYKSFVHADVLEHFFSFMLRVLSTSIPLAANVLWNFKVQKAIVHGGFKNKVWTQLLPMLRSIQFQFWSKASHPAIGCFPTML